MGVEGWVGHVGMAVCSESKELIVVGGPLARPTQPSSLRRLVHLCDDCFPGDLLLVSDFTFAFFAGLVHWVFVVLIIVIVTVACIIVAVMEEGEIVGWVACMGAV